MTESIPSIQEQYPFLSIIIPVYNDNRGLEQLLPSLMQQTYPNDKYEIIVIDNGSAEDVRSVTEKYENVTLLFETEIQSSYATRNKGIAHAKGTIYVFIDSDCRATENWLTEGISKLIESDSDMLGGQVTFDISQKPSAAEYYDAIHNFQFEEKIKRGTCGGGNTFIQKKVFDAIGGFPQHIQSGGDVYFSKKATSSGFSLIYASKAKVYHPARTFWPLMKKTFRIGVGKAAIKKMSEDHIGQKKIKTVQSGGIANLISPAALRDRILKKGYSVSPVMFWRIWLVGFCILASGFYGLIYGKIKHLLKS